MELELPLKIHFLPYLSPGHMVPLSELAQLFAKQGHFVTIITTPCNALLLQKYTSPNFVLHVVELQGHRTGVPDGVENFISVTDLVTAGNLYQAMVLMQPRIKDFIESNPPDCLVSDMFHPWTADLAVQLDIPRLVFHATCIFAMSLKEAMRDPNGPHRHLQDDYQEFEVPGLPDRIVMTRSQLPDYVRVPNGYTQLQEQWREAEMKSYGVIVNNFYELDHAYTDHYSKIMGHKVWNIGPAAPILNRDAGNKADRVHKSVVGENECLGWLDSKKPNSVLYICFGSACIFPDEQLYEIASGLMSSGAHFIWVVFGKDKETDSKSWLPGGFEDMVRDTGKGMIIRGWAPQLLILDHPAVGGFLTHCGWNSVIEGVCAGVPMMTWPLYAEHFYNEKLMTQVLKIGVEAGAEDWNLWVDAGKKLVKRDKIESAINKIMNDGEEASKIRSNAIELGKKAKKAVEEGGSSHKNLIALIEDLKKIRNNKANK